MCKASNSRGGKKRCKVSHESKNSGHARKRARYYEKKEIENGRRGNDEGTNGLLESSGMEQLHRRAEGGARTNLDGREDSNGIGSEPRLTIDGKLLHVKGVHTVPIERRRELKALKKSVPKMVELDATRHAGFFREKVTKLANAETNKWHASVYVYDEEEYKDMRLLMSQDGSCGIAIKSDGDIVSVFSNAGSPHKASANAMIATAVSLGGKKLDCFDTVLPHIYAQEGFVETGRMQWDDQYKPDAWDYDTYKSFNDGRPDVVFMERSEKAVA